MSPSKTDNRRFQWMVLGLLASLVAAEMPNQSVQEFLILGGALLCFIAAIVGCRIR